MSDDIPTQRFEQPAEPGTPPPLPPSRRTRRTGKGDNNRTRLIVLISVCAVLLVAVIVLVSVLIARNAGEQPAPTPSHSSASSSPSPSPSLTPSTSPTPTAPANAPTITSFTVSTPTVNCPADSTQPGPPLTFGWTSGNASVAYFGIDTTDAAAAPFFSDLPPNGDTSDFPEGNNPLLYSCKSPTHTYTITVVGNGLTTSKTLTVTNTGAQ